MPASHARRAAREARRKVATTHSKESTMEDTTPSKESTMEDIPSIHTNKNDEKYSKKMPEFQKHYIRFDQETGKLVPWDPTKDVEGPNVLLWEISESEGDFDETMNDFAHIFNKSCDSFPKYQTKPGVPILLNQIGGYLALVRTTLLSFELIEEMNRMLGYWVPVYRISEQLCVAKFPSLSDVFDAVNVSKKIRSKRMGIYKFFPGSMRNKNSYPVYHPKDPIFKESKRNKKIEKVQVQTKSNNRYGGLLM